MPTLTVTAMALLLSAPFIDVLAVAGGLRWLAAYGVIAAAGISAAAVAIALTIMLFRTIGPKRTRLVAQVLAVIIGAGFVIALYNPVSRARPWQLAKALALLGQRLPGATPVIFGRAVGRSDESVIIATLAEAGEIAADMATLIIVGSRETRLIARKGMSPLVYTPRAVERVKA